MASQLSDAQWVILVNEKVSEVLQNISASELPVNGAPLASITGPQDPRFPLAIDHTLLKQDATPAQIDILCDEAIAYGFKARILNCYLLRGALNYQV
jgi:deoxyribose-phosphate aldolase